MNIFLKSGKAPGPKFHFLYYLKKALVKYLQIEVILKFAFSHLFVLDIDKDINMQNA